MKFQDNVKGRRPTSHLSPWALSSSPEETSRSCGNMLSTVEEENPSERSGAVKRAWSWTATWRNDQDTHDLNSIR